MQQHQGPPHMLPPMQPQLPSTTSITTEAIQKYLDENKTLIMAILDNQNLGKLSECAQYQARLQNNLMYLAAIADAQPQISAPRPQMLPNPAMQQGVHYMQQHPNFALRPSQQFNPPHFQEQPRQHQLNHAQMLPIQGQMGMPALNNGVHAMHHPDGALGSSMQPAPSPHDFPQGGAGGSFDGRGNISVSDSPSLEGQRNSAAEQRGSDMETN